jgi:hypothetical protein
MTIRIEWAAAPDEADTFSFQARPFYEKPGYAQFGVLPD